MTDYITITQVNDFLYSPESLYLQNSYRSMDTSVYHDTPQTVGTANHKAIDNSTYSNRKEWLQGQYVASEEYHVIGIIDLYNINTRTLIERKTTVKSIYPGFKYQLWLQMICLQELGYPTESMRIYEVSKNLKHPVDLPTPSDLANLKSLVNQIRTYNVEQLLSTEFDNFHSNISIYSELDF